MTTNLAINHKGIVLSVCSNFDKIFGYTADEIVGKSINMIVPPPYKQQHDTYLSNYLLTGKTHVIDHNRTLKAQHKDGGIFPMRLSVSTSKVNDFPIFVGSIEKILDSSVYFMFSGDGVIISVDQNAQNLFGHQLWELNGKSIFILFQHDNFMKKLLKARELPSLLNRTICLTANNDKDQCFPVSMTVKAITISDVTFYRSEIIRIDDMEAVFTIDNEENILEYSDNIVFALFGYDSVELINKKISTIIPNAIPSISFFANLRTSGSSHKTLNQLEESLEEPQSKRCKLNRSGSDMGYELVLKDGESVHITLEMYKLINPVSKEAIRYCLKIKRTFGTDASNKTEIIPSVFVEDYQILKTIGKGNYSEVKEAVHLLTMKKYAVKIIRLSALTADELDRIKREVKIMKILNHPNIIKIEKTIEMEDFLYIVMELGTKTLKSQMKEKSFTEQESRQIFIQVATAIKHCHDNKIIHRDVKPENIMLDELNNCKIIDFGLSNFVSSETFRKTYCGTPAYAAPEMLLGEPYEGCGVDVWSLGVLLYNLVTGTYPFKSVCEIISSSYKIPDASKDCLDLISHMLDRDTKKRFDMNQVLGHPWIRHAEDSIKAVESPLYSEIV